VRWLLIRRPEMLGPPALVVQSTWPMRRYVLAGLTSAVLIAICLAPLASAWPDGLDSVGERLQFNPPDEATRVLLLSDYAIPLPHGMWEPLSVSLAGLFGTLVVFAIGWMLGRVVASQPVE
jgi:hypothetical protein